MHQLRGYRRESCGLFGRKCKGFAIINDNRTDFSWREHTAFAGYTTNPRGHLNGKGAKGGSALLVFPRLYSLGRERPGPSEKVRATRAARCLPRIAGTGKKGSLPSPTCRDSQKVLAPTCRDSPKAVAAHGLLLSAYRLLPTVLHGSGSMSPRWPSGRW